MMHWMRRWFFFALCAVACGASAQSMPPTSPAGGELTIGGADSYPLARSFTVMADPGRAMTLADVLKPEAQARFKSVPASGPGANFGLTAAAIWLRVNLKTEAGAPRDWLLEIAYPPLDSIELHAPDANGVYEVQHAGDQQPFASRVIAHRNHVLALHLPAGTSNVIYLRLQSGGTVSAPVTLWQPAALWRHDQANYAALSLYFGLLIGLLLYNLLLFVSVRDVAYLVYVAFAGSMALGQAALTGLGGQFLWPSLTWWNSVSPPIGLSAAAIFGLLFARIFLASAQRLPRIDKLLLAQVAGWVMALLAAAMLPYVVSSYMVTVLAVVSVATMVALGIISVRREFAGARYFITAWAVLLVGVAALSLHNVGVLPSNVFTANALLIGSALEMVLLSFALADRINVARRFKEAAQARIAAEHAMVEALSQSQDRLRSVLEEREIILESSIVGIAFLTPQGRFRWANQAMLDIFGSATRSSTSMEPFYLSREQYLRVGGEVASCVSRGEVYETELQMRRVDGSLIWVSLSGKAVSRENLSQGTVWVIMDITQRKELEAQLQKSSSEREAILNSALVGIVLSVNRRHEWVNDKFADMLGYPRQVLIGQSSAYIHPDEKEWERFGELARTALVNTGSYICERQLKRRNGKLLWVEMGGSCIRPHDPDSGVIWTFLDITERKKSEIEIREALEQQKALNELRSRFVAMTSHEFRTPLAAIQSAEELLRHYGDRLPQPERIEVLDSIASGVQRMSRMMDRVLLLGRADAGMLEFEPQRLDLVQLCRQLVAEARAQQPGEKREVNLVLGEGVGVGSYDEKLLRHVLGNLLSNALKYSPGGGEVRFGVRREMQDKGSVTVFEVSDQGIGIPADEIAHLFESFHRASNVGAIQGTGLGLAIVKNAVEMHGGTIEVQSRIGEGTTFTVRLPQH
ncbi:7TM diverse intracellular signaling domain-containing protein [Caenimonas sp. SL110]|uniref:7TM diverse intracellular signaling domain-containing protein n=1 Tax=Caenimonas sp. SL110 TaxID=1450524 RepID=UPI00069FCF50|nr:7TM diverse intracellular signaling domain-containing protein [Caenimonas sp. SL110]